MCSQKVQLMCADSFIAKARSDDVQFIMALAKGRSIRKEMNIEYGKLRRQTNLSILDVAKRGTTPKHPKPNEQIYSCKTIKKRTVPQKDNASDKELFVVKKVEMVTIKPN